MKSLSECNYSVATVKVLNSYSFSKNSPSLCFASKTGEFFLSYCRIILLYSHRNVPQQVSSQIQA